MASSKFDMVEQLLAAIKETETQEVRVSEDGFFERLATGAPHICGKRAARLVGLVLVTIAVAVFVIYSAIYFTQVILLAPNKMNVNRYGAFTIHSSSQREYAMFMFNSASPWQPSGIQVYEGDKILISASGGYHTRINKLIDAAKNNIWADNKEEYVMSEKKSAAVIDSLIKGMMSRYVFMSRKSASVPKLDSHHRKFECPKGIDNEAWFGDALFQIIPEYRLRDASYTDTSRIYSIPRPQGKKKHQIRVENSGMLAFCVNDINPYNNIGQMLVVMEIYRDISIWQTIKNFLTFSPLDMPYYLYDEIKHRGVNWYWQIWSVCVLLGMSLLELCLYCVILYYVPFLFLKGTWQKLKKI